jgi:hypothetical protein
VSFRNGHDLLRRCAHADAIDLRRLRARAAPMDISLPLIAGILSIIVFAVNALPMLT